MRKKIVVGNWKMNLMADDAAKRASELGNLVGSLDSVEVGLAPTFLCIPAVANALHGSQIGVSSQDVFWKESGAFTGFLSGTMLKDAGCKYAIIGHSERRGRFGKIEVDESTLPFFGETDETVNLKLKAAVSAGLVPIVCVGESLAEREANQTDAVIAAQIKGALAGIEDLSTLVVAYEPVWAIGTGKVCDSTEANRVCGFIRSQLPAAYRSSTRIQYGGSVNPANARELFGQPEIDGGLVGGASLKPEDFIIVIKAAS
jgi:triosephosphate isomerase (TIM)